MAKKQKPATEPAGEIVVNGEPAKEKRESIWKDVFAGIVSNKASLVSGIFILLLIVIALVTKFVPSVLPYDPYAQNLSESLLGPSAQHWFGTDIQGRDIFCRVLVGTQITLTVGLAAVAISLTVGVLLGSIAGYKGGKADTVIMRMTDIFLALPSLVLAMTIASLMEPNMTNTMIAVTLSWWPWYTRLVYSMATGYSKEYFIKNAELVGASRAHILFKELLPNCLSPVLTKMALDVGWVILLGASLSFIGLGEQPPTPSFGTMISEGSTYMPDYWWMTAFPALAIVFVILGFNFLGDGIRDMLDRGKQ